MTDSAVDSSAAADQDPMRVRLDVAYDGGEFHGWSRQPDQRTVQGVLERAIGTVLRCHDESPRLVVAGRTDAGVHAIGQVCHLDLDAAQCRALLRSVRGRAVEDVGDALAHRVNGVLGPLSDVVVTRGRLAPAGFDARFSALWRRYRYRVGDAVTSRDPLQRHRTAWLASRLEVEAMDAAARALVGLHDFAAYCKAPPPGATTIRTLQDFRWGREPDGTLSAEVRADAFCHSMVRSLVGACVAVGEGRLAPDDLVLLRDAAERTSAFRVMPARGLTLVEVGYPPEADLAARAERTRARRDQDLPAAP